MDFSQNRFFKNLNQDELRQVVSHSKKVDLDNGQILFQEGEEGESFFIIVEGEIEILKGKILLATLKRGDILGEMAVIGEHRRGATARAKGPVQLFEISLETLSYTPGGKEIAEKVRAQFPKILTERIKGGNITAAEAIQKQLEHEQARSHLGNALVYLLLLIFIYIYAIKAIDLLQIQVISTTIISIPILIIFAAFMLLLIRKTGYPWSEYGFTFKHWKKDLLASFLLTIPLLVVIFLFKWAVIQTFPTFRELHVISISFLSQNVSHDAALFIVFVAAYLIFVPVQEIIYRGAMQTTLEKLLLSKQSTWIAILISNLPFSLIHLHLSFILTIFVYFFGVFWGWMFAWQRSLIGCIFSHIITGFWTFFIIGIQDVLPA